LLMARSAVPIPYQARGARMGCEAVSWAVAVGPWYGLAGEVLVMSTGIPLIMMCCVDVCAALFWMICWASVPGAVAVVGAGAGACRRAPSARSTSCLASARSTERDESRLSASRQPLTVWTGGGTGERRGSFTSIFGGSGGGASGAGGAATA